MKILTSTLEFTPDYQIESIAPKGDMLLFDIETTGLKKETTQVYLIGCAFFEDNCWKLRQYLGQSALDEVELLTSFFEFARNYKVLIHFNGDGFDVPYLKYKNEYYGLGFDFSAILSFDIYKKAKVLRKFLGMSSMSQKSIETFLKIERDDQLNGGILIPFYYEYERTQDEKLEELLLLHNYDDVQGMFKILSILEYVGIIEGRFNFSGYELCKGYIIFNYKLEEKVPVTFIKTFCNGENSICAENDLLQISIKVCQEELKFPIKDIENYYYLPDEDIVIHKDVAQFVDKSHRKKATKKNCFLKKKSCFIPQNRNIFVIYYIKDDDKKHTYFEICSENLEKIDLLKEYALDIIGQ